MWKGVPRGRRAQQLPCTSCLPHPGPAHSSPGCFLSQAATSPARRRGQAGLRGADTGALLQAVCPQGPREGRAVAGLDGVLSLQSVPACHGYCLWSSLCLLVLTQLSGGAELTRAWWWEVTLGQGEGFLRPDQPRCPGEAVGGSAPEASPPGEQRRPIRPADQPPPTPRAPPAILDWGGRGSTHAFSSELKGQPPVRGVLVQL